MSVPPLLGKIIGWLRAGYPEGVPQNDYIPLFALLASHLTDADVQAVAAELASTTDRDSAQAISAAIKSVTDAQPSDADVARVRSHLAAGGWPLSDPA